MKQGLNWLILEVKLLKEVHLKVIYSKKWSNTFLPHIHFKKKMGSVFDEPPISPKEWQIPNFTVFTIKWKISLVPVEQGDQSKHWTHVFYQNEYGEEKYCYIFYI